MIIKNKKAQAALEYMAVYLWAIMILIIFVGAILYFDLLDANKYAASYCVYDSNFFCHNYVLNTSSSNTFSMSLLLQNNMDNTNHRPIDISNVKIYLESEQEIICDDLSIQCPFNYSTVMYGTASPSNVTVALDPGRENWFPTRICLVELKNCNYAYPTSTKHLINMEINFSKSGSTTTHISRGGVFAQVQN